MKVAVLGANGFVGRTVAEKLSYQHQITNIVKSNYQEHIGKSFDVFVNCNGNSWKFWANQNPKEDYRLSTLSVYDSLFDFHFKKYIYISSMDIYKKNRYGYHKKLAEDLIRNETAEYAFLRCCSVIGKGMKKGIVYDILNDIPLSVSPNSHIQLITAEEVARIVELSINNYSDIVNVGSTNAISIKEIGRVLGKKVYFALEAENQSYSYSVSPDLEFKTAKEYLKEIM